MSDEGFQVPLTGLIGGTVTRCTVIWRRFGGVLATAVVAFGGLHRIDLQGASHIQRNISQN